MPDINTVQEFGTVLKNGPYDPGGYPIYFVTDNSHQRDSGTLSFATAWNERSLIARAILDGDKTGGWLVVGYDINLDDPDLIDAHTGHRIESAYAEDDAQSGYETLPDSYIKWTRRVRGIAPTVRGPKIIRDLDGLADQQIEKYILGDVALDVSYGPLYGPLVGDATGGIFHVELMEVQSGARVSGRRDVVTVRSTSPCAAAYRAAKHFRLPSENLRVLADDYGCTENLVETEAYRLAFPNSGKAPRERSGPKIIRDLDGLRTRRRAT